MARVSTPFSETVRKPRFYSIIRPRGFELRSGRWGNSKGLREFRGAAVTDVCQLGGLT